MRDRYRLLQFVPDATLQATALDGDELRLTVRLTRAADGSAQVETTPATLPLLAPFLHGLIPAGCTYQLVVTEQQVISLALNGEGMQVPDGPMGVILGMSPFLRDLVKGLRENLEKFRPIVYQQTWDMVIQTLGLLCMQDAGAITRIRAGRPLQFRTFCLCCFNSAGRDRGTFQRILMQTPGAIGRPLGDGDIPHGLLYVHHSDPWYPLFVTLFEAMLNAILNDVRTNSVLETMMVAIERRRRPQ